MSDAIDKLLEHVEALCNAGRHEEVLRILRNTVSESDNLHVRFVAARGIAWIILGQYEGEFPPPGSPDYEEAREYLEVALDSFKHSDSETQRLIQESFDLDAVWDAANGLKMAYARHLEKSGRPEDAIAMLKEIVAKANRITDRLFAAGIIASITVHNFPQALESPSSQRFKDLREYVKIALQCYDQADQDVQEAFRRSADVNDLKYWLTQMDNGQPVRSDGGKKSGCFIATAACGSDSHHDVVTLYDFRDLILLHSRLGTLFVKAYYHIAPLLASVVARSQVLRWTVRTALIKPIVRVCQRNLSYEKGRNEVKK